MACLRLQTPPAANPPPSQGVRDLAKSVQGRCFFRQDHGVPLRKDYHARTQFDRACRRRRHGEAYQWIAQGSRVVNRRSSISAVGVFRPMLDGPHDVLGHPQGVETQPFR